MWKKWQRWFICVQLQPQWSRNFKCEKYKEAKSSKIYVTLKTVHNICVYIIFCSCKLSFLEKTILLLLKFQTVISPVLLKWILFKGFKQHPTFWKLWNNSTNTLVVSSVVHQPVLSSWRLYVIYRKQSECEVWSRSQVFKSRWLFTAGLANQVSVPFKQQHALSSSCCLWKWDWEKWFHTNSLLFYNQFVNWHSFCSKKVFMRI